jgi:capsid assembly protease
MNESRNPHDEARMTKPDWRCGASRTLPIGTDSPWNGDAAAARMLDAAGIGGRNPRPEIARRGFALYDAANPNARAGYMLPFADIVGGELTALKGGIDVARVGLPLARTADRDKLRARQILGHYKRQLPGAATAPSRDPVRASAPRPISRTNLLPHLAQRMFNTPLAVHPAKAEIIMAALADRLGVAKLVRADGEMVMLAGYDLDDSDARPQRGYDVVNGAAIIPVCGTLVQKLGSIRPYSGMTGYDGIRYNLGQALEDSDVGGIVLDIDSPGGEVCGLFDLVDAIYAARGRKPIWAILDEHAYSSAYAIASAADRIIVPRTGGTGSIGVIAVFADISRALQAGGVTVNVIQFGARKADGVPSIPFTPEARERFQADVDTLGDLFVATVARNRGIDAGLVRATEADAFLGAEGVRLRLADAVAAPDAAFAEFLQTL